MNYVLIHVRPCHFPFLKVKSSHQPLCESSIFLPLDLQRDMFRIQKLRFATSEISQRVLQRCSFGINSANIEAPVETISRSTSANQIDRWSPAFTLQLFCLNCKYQEPACPSPFLSHGVFHLGIEIVACNTNIPALNRNRRKVTPDFGSKTTTCSLSLLQHLLLAAKWKKSS
jgi:hypothetical protein